MQWGIWVWTFGHWLVLVQVIYCTNGRWVFFFFRELTTPWEEILSCGHSHKADLSITQSSLFSMWLSCSFFAPWLKPCFQSRVMSFVGVGGNIAISTTLPLSFLGVLYSKHQIEYEFLYLIFNACLRLWFLDMKTNPHPWHPVPTVCRMLSTQNTICSGVSEKCIWVLTSCFNHIFIVLQACFAAITSQLLVCYLLIFWLLQLCWAAGMTCCSWALRSYGVCASLLCSWHCSHTSPSWWLLPSQALIR